MPAVLVAGASATQNSPFSSVAVAVTIASTHCAYSRRDGQAELAWMAVFIARWFTGPKAITHPSTKQAPRRATDFTDKDQHVTTMPKRQTYDFAI